MTSGTEHQGLMWSGRYWCISRRDTVKGGIGGLVVGLLVFGALVWVSIKAERKMGVLD